MYGSALPIVVALVAAPRIGRRVSKPRAATIAARLGAAFNIAPYALRLLHVPPEARTGRRSEAVFFAGSFFVAKCTSAGGIFLALAIAGFPEKAIAAQVPAATIDRLTLTFGIT
jgi:GPH family glycoside/pentoside/hexuronide:cation symporter